MDIFRKEQQILDKKETHEEKIRVSDLCNGKMSDEETYLLVGQQKHEKQFQKTQDTLFKTSRSLHNTWQEILVLDKDAIEREAKQKVNFS